MTGEGASQLGWYETVRAASTHSMPQRKAIDMMASTRYVDSVCLSVCVCVIMCVTVPMCVYVYACVPTFVCLWYRLGLVVKASASRAEGPGFESRLRRDFFGVESYQ